MRGSDSDCEFRVAWIVYCDLHPGVGCPLLRRQRAIAGVACGNNHHHSGSHQAIDFNAQGTLSTSEPLWIEIVSKTDVHSVDQIQTAVAVLFLDVRDCCNQIADFAVTFVVEHLQTDQPATRRHPSYRTKHHLMSLYRGRIPGFISLNRSGDGAHFLSLRFGAISECSPA